MSPDSRQLLHLTTPQRDLLQRLAAADYGELYIKGSADHRVYRSLHNVGYVEILSSGWGKITPAGREAAGRHG